MSDKKLENRVIRFDWAMKRILRDKANFSILNGFLTVVLGEEVEIVELLESESNPLTADDKFNRVDLKAKNSKGEIIIVEVQNTREADYFHRVLYGTSRAVTEHLRRGAPYSEVKKVYSISIVYFSLGQGSDYAYHGTTEFHSVHNHDEILQLSESQKRLYQAGTPADIFPEYYILRVDNFNSVAATPLEEWISFLKYSEIPEEYKAPGLSTARDVLNYDRLTPEERLRYDYLEEYERSQKSTYTTAVEEGITKGIAEGMAIGRSEGMAIGRSEGMAQGMAQGMAEGMAQGMAEGMAIGRAEGEQKLKEEKLAIARKMLEKGMAVEDVAEMTGLSDEEISQMQ